MIYMVMHSKQHHRLAENFVLLLLLLSSFYGTEPLHKRRMRVVIRRVPRVHICGASVLVIQNDKSLFQGLSMTLLHCKLICKAILHQIPDIKIPKCTFPTPLLLIVFSLYWSDVYGQTGPCRIMFFLMAPQKGLLLYSG